MNAKIGDGVLFRKKLKPKGNDYYRYGKMKNFGAVTHIGQANDTNGYIHSLMAGKKELNSKQIDTQDRLIFVVPVEQIPEKMAKYLESLPEKVQAVLGVCRGEYYGLEFYRTDTLARVYSYIRSIEGAELRFEDGQFTEGKPEIHECYTMAKADDLEFDMPDDVEGYV